MRRTVSSATRGRVFGAAGLACTLAMCGGRAETDESLQGAPPPGGAPSAEIMDAAAGSAIARDGAAGAMGGGPSGSGGSDTGGAGAGGVAAGGTRDSGSSDAQGGAAPVDPHLGFSCAGDVCLPGNRCVQCGAVGSFELRCVPRPDLDPSGYARGVQNCELSSPEWARECDGPEDCLAGEYCSATTLRCSATSTRLPTFCCFSCGAPPYCDYCRADSDCPVNGECVRVFGDSELGGCLRRRCETGAECPAGWSCTDSHCYAACSDGGTCPEPEMCSNGYCR